MTTGLTRRGLLWSGVPLAGGASSAVLLSGCEADRSDLAHEPWRLWNAPGLLGTPLALISAAILCANPHDTQPWLFAVNEGSIDIFADTSRNLGAMDPMLREMHIGLGCAIENLCLAAGPNGYETKVKLNNGSLLDLHDRTAPAHAATVYLTKLALPTSSTSAYEAIPHRHTNRSPYQRARSVPKVWHDNLARLVDDERVRLYLFDNAAGREAYDTAVTDSTKAIITDAPMIADSDRWVRGSHAEIERYRSGPTLATAGLSRMIKLLAETVPLPAAYKHQAWLNQTRDEQVSTAPVTGLIAVRDRYDRPSALAAGRIWQRLHLSATLAHVAVQPLNQPMEVVDRDRQLGRGDAWSRRLALLVGDKGWQPTFSFRAGMSSNVAGASPRRALTDALLTPDSLTRDRR